MSPEIAEKLLISAYIVGTASFIMIVLQAIMMGVVHRLWILLLIASVVTAVWAR